MWEVWIPCRVVKVAKKGLVGNCRQGRSLAMTQVRLGRDTGSKTLQKAKDRYFKVPGYRLWGTK